MSVQPPRRGRALSKDEKRAPRNGIQFSEPRGFRHIRHQCGPEALSALPQDPLEAALFGNPAVPSE